MIKKTVKYTDFDGNERTETFYFHLSRVEASEWELSMDGGLSEHLNKIVEAKDLKTLIKLFKELVLKTYGQKSEDGRSFVKSKELTDGFAQTEAFDKLFMELATNDEAGSAFVNGVIPKDLIG